MRRPALFAAAFAAALFMTVSPRAEGSLLSDPPPGVLNADDRLIVDRIAADFFEHDLSGFQAQAIEDITSEQYRRASRDQKSAFLDARRMQWRELSAVERAQLQNCTRPRYGNLTEAQKAPFRRHAINRLKAMGATDGVAIVADRSNGI